MIRVRELLEFIQRNPNLVDYDAPVTIVLPEKEDDDVPGYTDINQLCLGMANGRLTLEVLVD